ncbi:serine hydrolase domain-containing protein [Algihabitans albus]|uniref:serine hydrolase domain-containing protein n=1 Tax=Algihabitans albus TaxID=2164067 RepID=UPI0013C2BF6F|nr:serine hydrolase domain-containing protein [Algihabitans albus]
MVNSIEDPFRTSFALLAAEQTRFAVGAAVARGGGEPVTLVSGLRHKRSQDPIGPGAPWHIGSITKSFTASLILKLVERDRLALDKPIGGLLPQYAGEMQADWRAITLRQALSHTAGLAANVSTVELLRAVGDDLIAERLTRLRRLWVSAPGGEPGRFVYSNLGYVLAGAVAEVVAGRSWEDLIVSEIARPLGLPSLGFGAPTDAAAPWGHQSYFGLLHAKDPRREGADNPAWMGPAGGLHLNLADLVAWGQAHLAACNDAFPAFLSRESCTEMRRPVVEDYGLGWSLQSLPNHQATLVWANGSNTLWYAVLGMVPERDLVMAVALNGFDRAFGDRALRTLLQAVLDRV